MSNVAQVTGRVGAQRMEQGCSVMAVQVSKREYGGDFAQLQD